MWRLVPLVRTDVSGKFIAFIIRVMKIIQLVIALLVTSVLQLLLTINDVPRSLIFSP
jgi:hypothetical protein